MEWCIFNPKLKPNIGILLEWNVAFREWFKTRTKRALRKVCFMISQRMINIYIVGDNQTLVPLRRAMRMFPRGKSLVLFKISGSWLRSGVFASVLQVRIGQAISELVSQACLKRVFGNWVGCPTRFCFSCSFSCLALLHYFVVQEKSEYEPHICTHWIVGEKK